MHKIVFLIPSLDLGGMERVMSQLLNHFSDKDIEVHLVLFGRNRVIKYDIPESVITHRPNFSYSNSNRFLFTLRTFHFIRKEVNTIKPSTVLSFGEYWNNMVLISLLGLKYPVYISDRSKPGKDLGFFQNKLRDFLYPKASGYIAQTNRAAEVAKTNKWNSNIRVIGNPILQESNQNDKLRENIILTVGRLIPTKHIDELINIFHAIKNPNWKLVIVGGDSNNHNLLEEYIRLIKKLNLSNQIELTGAKTNVKDYYKRAKIFAFTSSSEGFPNVIGEAMSSGLPVVSYDCVAGPSEMINNGTNGYLIQLHDNKEFIEKLILLMNDDSLRDNMGNKAVESIKKFSAEKIGEDFYHFITKK